MSIHSQLHLDLQEALKNNSTTISNLRYILGEFSRLKGKKDGKDYIGNILTDEQAIRVLKEIITGEETLLNYVPGTISSLKPLAETYLPKQVSREELLTFIATIDFSQLKNKMMAVGIVKKHFGPTVDGKMVNDIIQNIKD